MTAATGNASLNARSILNPAGAGGVDASGKAVPVTAAAALGPQQGLPALQSSRLFCGIVPPVNLTGGVGEIGVTRLDTGQSGAGLSKKMLQKMNLYLRELDIPENPLPTKAVCDLVEQVKLNTVTLLSLHNALGRKEKELQLLLSGADPAAVLNESSAAPRCKKQNFNNSPAFVCIFYCFFLTCGLTVSRLFPSQSSSKVTSQKQGCYIYRRLHCCRHYRTPLPLPRHHQARGSRRELCCSVERRWCGRLLPREH